MTTETQARTTKRPTLARPRPTARAVRRIDDLALFGGREVPAALGRQHAQGGLGVAQAQAPAGRAVGDGEVALESVQRRLEDGGGAARGQGGLCHRPEL
jgi:hypothetical protein